MDRTLGIDVGTAIVGWAIVERTDNSKDKLACLDYGTVVTSSKLPDYERLSIIFSDLNEIIRLYSPKIMAVESLFFFKNQKTVMTVSQARGVILLAGIENALVIEEYTPLQVKMGVTGYGRADKNQVQSMVEVILGMQGAIQSDDAADALAIAITSLNTRKYDRANKR